MNRIIFQMTYIFFNQLIFPESGTAICQSGCVMQHRTNNEFFLNEGNQFIAGNQNTKHQYLQSTDSPHMHGALQIFAFQVIPLTQLP